MLVILVTVAVAVYHQKQLGFEQTPLLPFKSEKTWNLSRWFLLLLLSRGNLRFFFSFSQISDSNLRLRFLPFASLKPNNFEIQIQNKIKSVIEIFDSMKFQTQI